VRLTGAERLAIARIAERRGLSKSDALRELVVTADRQATEGGRSC